jgi:hypothetical protein
MRTFALFGTRWPRIYFRNVLWRARSDFAKMRRHGDIPSTTAFLSHVAILN